MDGDSLKIFEIILVFVLLLFSSFFSMSEAAFLSISEIKLKRFLEKGSKRAKIISDFLKKPSHFIGSLVLGNNFVNILISVIGANIAIKYFGEIGIVYATIVLTFVIVVFGEMIPKIAGNNDPENISLVFSYLLLVLYKILYPISFVISAAIKGFLKIFGVKVIKEKSISTQDEVKLVVRMGEEEGVLEKEEKQMIYSIFEFGDKLVYEVMTPRVDIVALPVDATFDEARKVVVESGHSRVPVYDKNLDNIVGLLYVRDLLKSLERSPQDIKIKNFLREALFVPDTKKINELFKEMQIKKIQTALLFDEYGGLSGLVTMEDLLEEIVGEIHDEYDKEKKPYEKIMDNVFVVDAALTIGELNEILEIDLEESEDYDTVGGLILALSGHIPIVGEEFVFNGLKFKIEEIYGRRIRKVRVEKLEKEKIKEDEVYDEKDS